MFQQRKLVIATKHGKESVIAPLVEDALGVQCVVLESFDSDQFGTFSGEVKRNQDALETARLKCHAAMDASGCDLAMASEGSFGQHPVYFFAQADDEIVLFVDRKHGIEIWARELSTQTNFNGKEVRSTEELMDFVQAADFPSHAVILRESSTGANCIHKGVNTAERLQEAFNDLIQRFGTAYVETDMRAMHNPTRMKAIEKATAKLVEKILSVCPSCAWPGFDVTDRKSGLPCSDCGMPTQSTLSHIYCCVACGFEREHVYPKGKETEEPRYCDYCNP
jgi:hypothetical protein